MAIFGLKYYAELRSKYKGVLWRVEISERGYACLLYTSDAADEL